MPKVRNMYIGGKQIKTPYLGSNALKAVYLGSTMVWGDRNAKVWVLDRTTQNTTTDIQVSGISSSYISYKRTTSNTFTTANANSYPYTELTSDTTVDVISLWPANHNDCPFLKCYIYEYDNANLSFPSNSYLEKIGLYNRVILNPTSSVTLDSRYRSEQNSTQLEYLNEKDYVMWIAQPNFSFKVKTLKLQNDFVRGNISNINKPKIKTFKIGSPSISLTNTIYFNTDVNNGKSTQTFTEASGNNGVFEYYIVLEVNPGAGTLYTGNLGVEFYLTDSSNHIVSDRFAQDYVVTNSSINITKTIGKTPSGSGSYEGTQNLRLIRETSSNEELYLNLHITTAKVAQVTSGNYGNYVI